MAQTQTQNHRRKNNLWQPHNYQQNKILEQSSQFKQLQWPHPKLQKRLQ